MEVGFRVISKILLLLTNNIQATFGAISLLTTLIYIKAYEKMFGNENIALFYFIFLMTTFISNFNGVRQGLAMSIVFYAVPFLYKNNIVKYLLIIFIAGTIHTSALLALPLVIIKLSIIIEYLNKKPFIFLIFIIAIISSMLFIIQGNLNIFIDKFLFYFTSEVPGGELSNTLDLMILVFLLLHTKYYKKEKKYEFTLKAAPFYILVIFLGYQSVGLLRFKSVFEWIPQVLTIKLNTIYREKIAINSSLVILYIILFIIVYGVLGQSNIVPYQWEFIMV